MQSLSEKNHQTNGMKIADVVNETWKNMWRRWWGKEKKKNADCKWKRDQAIPPGAFHESLSESMFFCMKIEKRWVLTIDKVAPFPLSSAKGDRQTVSANMSHLNKCWPGLIFSRLFAIVLSSMNFLFSNSHL